MDHERLACLLSTLEMRLARLNAIDRTVRRERWMRAEVLALLSELGRVPRRPDLGALNDLRERLTRLPGMPAGLI